MSLIHFAIPGLTREAVLLWIPAFGRSLRPQGLFPNLLKSKSYAGMILFLITHRSLYFFYKILRFYAPNSVRKSGNKFRKKENIFHHKKRMP